MMIVFVINKYLLRMKINFADCLLLSTHLSLAVKRKITSSNALIQHDESCIQISEVNN